MDTINTIELKNPDYYPDDTVLQKILGPSFKAYKELLYIFEQNEMQYEWRYYKDGKAWLCKVQKRKKTIVWMSAWKGYMQASIYIPLKNIDEVMKIGIDKATQDKIKNTRDVGKSKPCIFEIKNIEILEQLKMVMQYKESLMQK